ncbi:MAG TPA: hypothetical protein VN957_06020 [Chthoniobacterales bacterium]|nr:hypothetical protein [Chthoniobacterales bacterium]
MNRSTERSLITRRRSGQRIWYDGRNWTAKTFYNEGASYRRSSKSDNLVKVGRFIVGHGIELFRLAKEKGLEGIIAKRAASTYQPRRRSPDRLKINARLKKKFVIGDITKGKASRKQM